MSKMELRNATFIRIYFHQRYYKLFIIQEVSFLTQVFKRRDHEVNDSGTNVNCNNTHEEQQNAKMKGKFHTPAI